MGLLASALTENQIIAVVGAFGVLLILWVIGWTADAVGGGGRCAHISIIDHLDSFSKGVLDTKDIIYYLTSSLLGLFLTLRAVESRRWKG